MYIPYIGITDFTTFEQVEGMLAVFQDKKRGISERRLHVGVMMSYKTLHGLPTKWSAAFPPKEAIAGIFDSDEVMNCLHYANHEHDAYLWKSLRRAIDCGGIFIDALQLDMAWPDPAQVAHGIHTSRKQLEVILQIGTQAIADVGGTPDGVVERLGDYAGVIHRVLLDRSMGKGIGMNAAELRPFVRAIRKHFPELGIGVAGGLGPDTLELVEPIAKEFPDISIDAQGKLRPSGDALDPIDWGIAAAYLTRALALFA